MKVKELLSFVDKIVPHSFPEEVQIRWINEVEGRVQTEILLLSDEDLTSYSWPEHQETELFAKFPYDDIYWTYLAAMVAHANGEFGEYNNHITLFNERFLRFSAWYAGRYRPADGEAAARLYYLSAYGIALKHGFAGPEEAWLESLKGDPFTYEDFTPEQLQALVPKKGVDYWTPEEIGEAAGIAADAAAAAVMQSTADNARQAEEAANAAKRDAERAEGAKDAVENLGVSATAGEPGGEASVVKTVNADGTVTLQFTLPRGQQGPQGPEGPEGERGPRGHVGPEGPEGPEGPQGPRGYNGTNGKDGLDGYTPVRGVDYWTPTDRSEIVAQVLAALPNGDDTEYPEGVGGANTFTFSINGEGFEAEEDMTWREWVNSKYCPTWPCPDCGGDEKLFVAWEDRACVCKLATCSEGPWYSDFVKIVCGDNDEDPNNPIEGRDYWLREVCSNCWNETCSCDEENGYDGPPDYGTCVCGEPLDENGNCTVMQGPICNGWVEE